MASMNDQTLSTKRVLQLLWVMKQYVFSGWIPFSLITLGFKFSDDPFNFLLSTSKLLAFYHKYMNYEAT